MTSHECFTRIQIATLHTLEWVSYSDGNVLRYNAQIALIMTQSPCTHTFSHMVTC